MADKRPTPGSHDANQSPPREANPTQDKKTGWIEGLAKRSTGLPADETPTEKPSSDKSPWSYAGLGLQFAATTGLFAFMGYELDRWRGWSPWGVVTLTMIAVIGGLYLLIKDVVKANAASDRPPLPLPQ